MTAFAPRSSRASTDARPSPEAPPVTTAVRPSIRIARHNTLRMNEGHPPRGGSGGRSTPGPMLQPVAVTVEAAPQIAAFTRVACPYDLLTTGSVERSIFAEPDPQVVLAVYDGGLDTV